VQDDYRDTALARFANDALADPVERVGRQPLRKLSRHERLIEPAAALAEQGEHPVALLDVIGAALRFVDVPDDPESSALGQQLDALTADAFVTEVMGLASEHPLHAALVQRVADAQHAR
jgi:mannitol-1-phosphate 5-dehydrogenase